MLRFYMLYVFCCFIGLVSYIDLKCFFLLLNVKIAIFIDFILFLVYEFNVCAQYIWMYALQSSYTQPKCILTQESKYMRMCLNNE